MSVIKRESNGHFKKGFSANPTGRPAIIAEVADLAREHTVEAIKTLAEIMSDRKAPAQARVAAASAVLDRGYGKPPQALTGHDGEALVVKIIKFAELSIAEQEDHAVEAIH